MSTTRYKMIRVSEETHNLLSRFGTFQDSYESIIRKLVSEQKTTEVEK